MESVCSGVFVAGASGLDGLQVFSCAPETRASSPGAAGAAEKFVSKLMLPGLNINRNIIKITRGGKLSQGEVATDDYLKLVARVQFALLTRLYLLVRVLRFDWRNVAVSAAS
jgi:hypothetical protein